MKKVISIILSALMVFVVLTPMTVFGEDEDYKAEKFDENVELAEKLGYDLSDYLTDEEENDVPVLMLEEQKESNKSLVLSENEIIDNEVISKDLPKQTTAKLFEPLVLYFNVKKGVRINKVSWYIEGTQFSTPIEIEGPLADSNLLFIPSFAFGYGDFIIEAVIEFTDYRKESPVTGKAFTQTDVAVDDSITEGNNQVINIGDFSIFPGQSLNLGYLGVGKGKISLNKTGDTITLENVEYTYSLDNLLTNRLFTMNKGFSYYTYNNELENIKVKLIGKNKISSLFHFINNDEDGGTFSIVCEGRIVEENPNIYITGPGSLDLYGGQYNIVAFGTPIIDTELNLCSSKYDPIKDPTSTPARMGTGIFCVGATLTKNARVNMDIAGIGINAGLAVDGTLSNIDIQPGAVLNIKDTSYIRHPWKYMNLPSKISGLVFINSLKINDAEVNLEMVCDGDLYHAYEQKEGYEKGNIPVYSITGISTDGKDNYTSSIDINNSDVNISISTKCEDDAFELIRAYGFDTLTYVSDKNKPSMLNINDSNVNVNIFGNILASFGMNISDASLFNSDIDMDVYANNYSFGIFQYQENKNETLLQLKATNSDVDITATSSIGEDGRAFGVYATEAYFTYDKEDIEFNINADDGALVSYIEAGTEPKEPVTNYVPEHIFLSGTSEIVNNYPINFFTTTKRISPFNTVNMQEDVIVDESATDYYRIAPDRIMLRCDDTLISNDDVIDINEIELEDAVVFYYSYESFISAGQPVQSITIRKAIDTPSPKKNSKTYVIPKTGVR